MKILVVCTTDSMIWNFLIPHIKFLIDKGVEVECACSRTGFYFDELVNLNGLVLHEVCFERNPFKKRNLMAFSQLKNIIKEGEFDLIHCHEPVGGAMGRLAGKCCKKKVMYFAHGFHFFSGAPLKHWFLYYVFEYLLSFLTDSIITICHEDYDRAKRLHAKRCYYIHGIGVNFNKYNIDYPNDIRKKYRKEIGLLDTDIALLSVGELSIRKNHKVVVEALKKLNNPNLHFVICGEGDELANLEGLVNNLGLNDKVHFMGFRRDIPYLLRACDYFIFPSLWEGLGLAGIEAMYCGLPVIGSNRQGIKDYVIAEETGFLFEPNNPEQLCDIIENIIQVDNKTMINKGIEIASSYSLERVVEELDVIYKKEKVY